MVTLGFFAFGGDQWTPYINKPEVIPNTSYFAISNSTSQACRDCIHTEARCDALIEPWKSQCNNHIDSVLLAQSSECDVRSFVGAGNIPKGTALVSVLNACSTVCSISPGVFVQDYMRGYDRPYLSLS